MLVLGTTVRTPAQELSEDKRSLKVLGKELSKLSQELADEYLDILEQLGDVIEEYNYYTQDLDESARSDHTISLERVRRNLENKTYIDSQEKLLDDVYDLVGEIKHLEAEHKIKFDTRRPQCCQAIHGLRRDLVIIADLLEDYINKETIDLLQEDDIRLYLEVFLEKVQKVLEEKHINLEEKLKALELSRLGPVVIIPPVPQVPPKTPQRIGTEKLGSRYSNRRTRGLDHEYEASAEVVQGKLPVYIVNPTGDILITGWNENLVSARLEIEVHAKSRLKEKDLIEQTSLEVRTEKGGCYVEVVYPKITDPGSSFLRSQLIVSVPAQNRVECENSFGEIMISALLSGITVTGNNSKVELDNVRGEVTIVNSMGLIEINDLVGPARIKSTYGNVLASGCDGDLHIDNAYAMIKLADTRGTVKIRNSGQITIDNHTGELNIKNDYGQVDIRGIDGRVVASNSYQPLVVSDISGSVKLENIHGLINASRIEGALIAVNQSGRIMVQMLMGPIDLTNKDGDIAVILDDDFTGVSSVVTYRGTISIALSRNPNLRITAEAKHGSITGTALSEITNRGNLQLAELKLGQGVNLLALSGKDVDIIINKHR